VFARRLAHDYEKQTSNSKATIYLAQTAMLTKRLTGQTTPTRRGRQPTTNHPTRNPSKTELEHITTQTDPAPAGFDPWAEADPTNSR
jgi:hypothetical protein